MTRVFYTRSAEADLEQIAKYTLAQWGAAQCAKYIDLLEQSCEVIVPQNAVHAPTVPERPKLRRWRCERHPIYFRKVPGGLEIVRILHERMLPRSHF